MGLALFVGKRHQRGRAWGFAQLYRSPNQLGLICLSLDPQNSRVGDLDLN
jgi:hypothetical protein